MQQILSYLTWYLRVQCMRSEMFRTIYTESMFISAMQPCFTSSVGVTQNDARKWLENGGCPVRIVHKTCKNLHRSKIFGGRFGDRLCNMLAKDFAVCPNSIRCILDNAQNNTPFIMAILATILKSTPFPTYWTETSTLWWQHHALDWHTLYQIWNHLVHSFQTQNPKHG